MGGAHQPADPSHVRVITTPRAASGGSAGGHRPSCTRRTIAPGGGYQTCAPSATSSTELRTASIADPYHERVPLLGDATDGAFVLGYVQLRGDAPPPSSDPRAVDSDRHVRCERCALPLTAENAQGRLVLVARARWPDYACNEHNGEAETLPTVGGRIC